MPRRSGEDEPAVGVPRDAELARLLPVGVFVTDANGDLHLRQRSVG